MNSVSYVVLAVVCDRLFKIFVKLYSDNTHVRRCFGRSIELSNNPQCIPVHVQCHAIRNRLYIQNINFTFICNT